MGAECEPSNEGVRGTYQPLGLIQCLLADLFIFRSKNMFKQLASVLSMAAALVAAPAMAQSYDFSNFATNGQSFQGVTLGNMTLTSENGQLVYTDGYGGGIYDGFGGSNEITLTFAAPITAISVRAGDGAGDFDAFGLVAYAFGTNNVIASVYSPKFGGPAEPEWFTLSLSGLGAIGRW